MFLARWWSAVKSWGEGGAGDTDLLKYFCDGTGGEWAGGSGRSKLMVTVGCWLWWPTLACIGRLLGGFVSRAGGTGRIHMSQGEVVAVEGWDGESASGMVVLGGVEVGGEATVSTINCVMVISCSSWSMHLRRPSGCTVGWCQSLRLSSM